MAVFTDRKSTAIRERCEQLGISCFAGNPRGGKAADFLPLARCEVVLSVNYLFIIERDIIDLASRYAVNVHGSLLPRYRGRTPHVWAIINGETETGITAHLIEEALDAGDIVGQIRLPIAPEATGADLLAQFRQLYPQLLAKVLADIAADTIEPQPQDARKATYFPKRTPDDGGIDWSWSGARIRNWVRAQAPPYPGAFTSWQGRRLPVHRAEFSDWGFRHDQPNGTVLVIESDALIVKVADGALRLTPFDASAYPLLHPESILS